MSFRVTSICWITQSGAIATSVSSGEINHRYCPVSGCREGGSTDWHPSQRNSKYCSSPQSSLTVLFSPNVRRGFCRLTVSFLLSQMSNREFREVHRSIILVVSFRLCGVGIYRHQTARYGSEPYSHSRPATVPLFIIFT
ncbi:MAG: hypothetical protein N5P05_004659 (plasmid) [Chroococcopsis gigantea SAG 12.99]|nr:hypothetical protein [Chroococcopsis gigantea SAG 12.99]